MRRTYNFITASVDKTRSNVSFKCNWFAPLPRDATNFETGHHLKKNYSVLHYTKTETKMAMQSAFCTQLCMKSHRSVYFCDIDSLS
jgi:hypothetical protein